MTVPTARPSRREAKKDECRRQIARAAVHLFETKGFAAATMDEVAERADVSRPTVFNYFAHKEEIPAYFMGWMLEERVASQLGTSTGSDPVPAIGAMLGSIGSIFGDFPETARTFHMLRMQEARKDCRPPMPPPDHPMQRILGHLIACIEQAQAAGTFRGDFGAREILPHLGIGLFASTFGPWLMGEFGDVPYGEVVERHFDLYVAGLRST